MLYLLDDGVDAVTTNLVADRLRVNKLALTMAAWVAGTVARVNEVPLSTGRHLGLPPSLAELVAVMAFGDELLDRVLPYPAVDRWLTPGGRKFAAAYLLPRAEAALRSELQRLADAAKARG
jgi:hypothetical protein